MADFVNLEEMDSSTHEGLRKLFIGGLNRSTTDEKLEAHFLEYGELTDHVIIKDPESKMSRGFGFVTFKNIEDADSCVATKNQMLDGKTMDVKRAIPRDKQNGGDLKTKKVFLGGLPPISEDELRNLFDSCPLNVKVDTVEVIKNKETQEHKGFGFVTFEDEDHVAKVATTHYFYINGKKVEARISTPKEKDGQHGGDSRGRGRGRGGMRGGRGGRGGGRGGGESGNYNNYNNGNYNQGGWDNSGGYGNGGYSGYDYSQGGPGYGDQYGYGYNQYGGTAGGQNYWDQDQSGGYNNYNYSAGGGGGGRGAGSRGRGNNRYTPY